MKKTRDSVCFLWLVSHPPAWRGLFGDCFPSSPYSESDSGYLSGNCQAFVCGPVQVAMALPVGPAKRKRLDGWLLCFPVGGRISFQLYFGRSFAPVNYDNQLLVNRGCAKWKV